MKIQYMTFHLDKLNSIKACNVVLSILDVLKSNGIEEVEVCDYSDEYYGRKVMYIEDVIKIVKGE